MSPIQHIEETTQKMSPKGMRSAKLHDTQMPKADIPAFIKGKSNKKLKALFPKAYKEHQTVKRRCRDREAILHRDFEDFRVFLADLGPCPNPSWSVDRRDNSNRTYGPGLCQWASNRTQANNRSSNALITHGGETHTLAVWARKLGIPYQTVKKRYQRELSPEDILSTTPLKGARRQTEVALPAAPIEVSAPAVPAPKRLGWYVPGMVIEPPAEMSASGWPEGLNVPSWEAAYDRACKAMEGHPDEMPWLTRACFAAWIIGSLERHFLRIVDRKFPHIAQRQMCPDDDLTAECDARAVADLDVIEVFRWARFLPCLYRQIHAELQHRSPVYLNHVLGGVAGLIQHKSCADRTQAHLFWAKHDAQSW